jgi:chromosome segregation protein
LDASGAAAGAPPVAGAERLLDLVRGEGMALAVARRLLADAWVVEDLNALPAGFAGIAVTRAGRAWFALPGASGAGGAVWGEVRQVAAGGVDVVLERRNHRERLIAESEAAAQAEVAARGASEQAAAAVAEADRARDAADRALREADRRRAEAAEAVRRSDWLIAERRRAPEQGPLAVRRAELEGELVAERRQAERAERERAERERRRERLRAQLVADTALVPRAERLIAALEAARKVVAGRVAALEQELTADRAAGEDVSSALRTCAAQEAEIHGELRAQGEAVTNAEVAAQRLRDQAAEAEHELSAIAERLGLDPEPAGEALADEQREALAVRVERLQRRREQLGPVNPLAQGEYQEALAHVEELETRRADLETALRELRTLIRDTDRQIEETFEATFSAAAANFEALVGDVFPGGRGRLRLVREDSGPRAVLGGSLPRTGYAPAGEAEAVAAAEESEAAADAEAEREAEGIDLQDKNDLLGVEIEITPAGKSAKRLSLLSGGEKSMTALAFLFAVFLAKPCPFYILDEVEAALDDLNLDRFINLLRRYRGQSQFIVITHQKRTMEAADTLYGVSMGGDGVSKVISRRLPDAEPVADDAVPRSGQVPAAGVA